eukprot:COSAG02_NODE_3789_length_6229_cov_3.678630_7_plen_38_part_00
MIDDDFGVGKCGPFGIVVLVKRYEISVQPESISGLQS